MRTNKKKCLFCGKYFKTKAHINFLNYVKFCSKYCRETSWKEKHPIRYKRQVLKHRLKLRRQSRYCKQCSKKIVRKSGKQFCLICSKSRRKKQQRLVTLANLKERKEYKLKEGCYICGYSQYPEALDFHHKDPKKKRSRVHTIRSKEIKKCIVICANCHRHETFKKKGKWRSY